MQRRISQSIRLTQSSRRQDLLAPPNDFPIFTESASNTKINIPDSKEIRIHKIFIAPNTYRSKQALNNPASLAFVFATDLESLFENEFEKTIDPGTGIFSDIVAPNTSFPIIENQPDINYNKPFVVRYKDIDEYSDFPTNSILNYPKANIGNLIRDPENKIFKEVADVYMLQSMSPIQPDTEIVFPNSLNYQSLYIIPFFDDNQRTEFVLTARINFLLEY